MRLRTGTKQGDPVSHAVVVERTGEEKRPSFLIRGKKRVS